MSKRKHKVERPLNHKEEMALDLVKQACELMGWNIAIPKALHGEPLYWLLIGTEEGLDTAMKRINGEMN